MTKNIFWQTVMNFQIAPSENCHFLSWFHNKIIFYCLLNWHYFSIRAIVFYCLNVYTKTAKCGSKFWFLANFTIKFKTNRDASATSSTLKTLIKFWGNCFKFWLRPWNTIRMLYHNWYFRWKMLWAATQYKPVWWQWSVNLLFSGSLNSLNQTHHF